MDVSVIYVSYNTCGLTLQSIRSVVEKTSSRLNYEIIVVDNNSHDNTVVEVQGQFPQVRIIKLNENIGFGRANNVGVQSAAGKYIYLLNTDTVLLNDAILMYFSYMEVNNKKVCALGSQLFDVNKNKAHSSYVIPTFKVEIGKIFNSISNYILKKPLFSYECFINEDKYLDVGYITGASLFMEKSFFDKVGGFDPLFFMYYEEVDLQVRMKKFGKVSRLISGPLVVHLEGASSQTNDKYILSKRKIDMIETSKVIYLKKYTKCFALNQFMYSIVSFLLFFDPRISFRNRMYLIKKRFAAVCAK